MNPVGSNPNGCRDTPPLVETSNGVNGKLKIFPKNAPPIRRGVTGFTIIQLVAGPITISYFHKGNFARLYCPHW